MIEPGRPSGAARHAELSQLRNIGPKSVALLAAAGFADAASLRSAGPSLAFRLAREVEPTVSMNLLWAIEGALTDRDWRAISPQRKALLLRELN